MNVAAWVSQEEDSETEISVQDMFRGCSWDPTPMAGKGREGSKIGQREKSGCGAVSMDISA